MIRGRAGARFDRVIRVALYLCAVIAAGLLGWLGPWRRVLWWPR